MILRAALLAVQTLAVVAPRGPVLSPRAPRRVPVAPERLSERATALRPGESLTYRIRLRGMESGRAALAVGKPGPGRRARTVALRGAVEPLPALRALLPFRAEMISYVDRQRGFPERTITTRSVRESTKRVEATYRPNRIEVREDGGKSAKLKRRHGHATHDALSALWSLRSRERTEGERIRFVILDGNKSHSVRLVAGKVERIRTPVGEVMARRFEGTWRAPRRKPRTFTLWLSADDVRVPVRLDGDTRMGPARFDLVDYSGRSAKARGAARR